MMVHASSSVIAAGIKETMPVPALPFLMTQKSSPSFRFLWNLQFVKFRGLGLRIAPAGPSPFPSLPWQLKQVPFPSNRAFPLATLSGVFAYNFRRNMADVIMAALLVVFAIRLTKTKKFMPSGLMLTITLAALAFRHLAL